MRLFLQAEQPGRDATSQCEHGYPVGWLMALLGAVISSLRFFKAKYQRAHA